MLKGICTGHAMTQTPPPPRLHVIPARGAPVAAVLARGPSSWFHVLKWDTAAGAVERGAWLRATIYPRRCAVSPDGTLLCSFILAGRPAPWDSYFAVSKLPWLTALAAWRVGSTYAAPCQFHADGTLALGFPPDTPPDHGSYSRALGTLTPYPPTHASIWAVADLANELRRGWRVSDAATAAAAVAAAPSPAAEVVIERRSPNDEAELQLVHAGHDHGAPWVEGAEVHYVVAHAGRRTLLDGVVWADWDASGRMLVATEDGALEVREPRNERWRPVWRHELGDHRPDPVEAPDWARRW
jgi:hypothetical protein